jgi:hypothetical protein
MYNLFFNASRIISFAHSAYPLALGCATETYLTTMPLSSQKFQKLLPVNMEPRLVIMLLGKPKWWIISSSSSAAFCHT